MKNTGRKTVRGGKTSAPMVVKATAQLATSATHSGASAPPKRHPTREEIARRSYEIFLARGGEHGHDVEHWVQAERDLGL